jgi:hypothetical protein
MSIVPARSYAGTLAPRARFHSRKPQHRSKEAAAMQTELLDIRAGKPGAPERPTEQAPPASSPYEERAEWSEQYVAWFIAQTPQDEPLPADVSPTHRYEVEFSYCVLNPQRYERETQAELSPRTLH